MTEDTSLIRKVHQEACGTYDLFANLDRFGGLTVLVFDSRQIGVGVWQGDNIIAARNWIITQQLAEALEVGVVAL